MIKKSTLCILFLITGIELLICQVDSTDIPLFKYQLSGEIMEELSSGNLNEAFAAPRLTFIGEYLKAQEIAYDGPIEWGLDTLSDIAQAHLQQFSPQDAVSAIIRESANQQIIIINEAHHRPQHRLFTRKLLTGLYEEGYRYFGLEALVNIPDSIERKYSGGTTMVERGYPISSSIINGPYVVEPQMANLIRDALSRGYEVFRYEQFGDERELNQAKNIASILEADPSAKILIHCG